MDVPGLIIKILALIIGGICYGLLTMFHFAIFTAYEKLIICAVFSGFFVLYLAFTIGTVFEQDVDGDLNTVWALYGFAAYMGAGVLCIILFTDRDDKEAVYGMVAGAVSIVQSLILALDAWFLQRRISLGVTP